MGRRKLNFYVMSATFQNLSPKTHNGQSAWTTGLTNNRAGFPAHCGGSSLGQSCGGHQNMRNSEMNRYTIANISECQRYLRSIYFDAHSINNCQDVNVSESLRKIAKILGLSAWLVLLYNQCDSS